MKLITSPSDNEYFSADSLEEDTVSINNKKKKKTKNLKKLFHHHKRRRKTYLELYQSRLAFEFLKYGDGGANDNDSSELCENEKFCESVEKHDEVLAIKMNAKKCSTLLWSEFLSRNYKKQHALSQANSKTEMLKRRTDYGCRMSSMNRLNRFCQDLHRKTLRYNSSSSQSLSNNDNGSNENASTSKMTMISTRMTKNSKDSPSSHEIKEKSRELQEKLEQMQIRHCLDRQKVEKIQNSLM